MSASSPKSSGETRPRLALDPGIRARIGEKRYHLIKLWVQDVNGVVDAAIAPHIGGHSRVLDAGSSRGDPDLPSLAGAYQSVACDADLAGLRANSLVRDRVAGFLEKLPFRNESFDLVVCKFVVEHLAAPLAAFREFWRVLRPGGVVAVLTPNRWSAFAWLSSLIPYRVRRLFKKSLFGGHEEDTFATLYRANTRRRLNRTMQEAGFALEGMRMLAGMWAFFIFSRPLALAVRSFERLQARIPLVQDACTYILGVWRKPVLEGGRAA